MEALTCLDAFLKHLGSNCNFGCGLLVFGSFKPVLELFGLVLLFGFGLKVLNFSWYCKGFTRFLCDFGGKSALIDIRSRKKQDFDKYCVSKIASCRYGLLKYVQNPTTDCDADIGNKTRNCPNEDFESDKYVEDDELYDEDLEFDVLTLRRLVKNERRRANSANLELEKERMAAATAAEETMAMILRLQNEKSLIEMESKQYKRLAEEKQLHDQEVIQSLQWLVMKHESERAILEEQLRICQQKLNPIGNDEEECITPLKANNVDDFGFDPCLFSSLDMDFSLDKVLE